MNNYGNRKMFEFCDRNLLHRELGSQFFHFGIRQPDDPKFNIQRLMGKLMFYDFVIKPHRNLLDFKLLKIWIFL